MLWFITVKNNYLVSVHCCDCNDDTCLEFQKAMISAWIRCTMAWVSLRCVNTYIKFLLAMIPCTMIVCPDVNKQISITTHLGCKPCWCQQPCHVPVAEYHVKLLFVFCRVKCVEQFVEKTVCNFHKWTHVAIKVIVCGINRCCHQDVVRVIRPMRYILLSNTCLYYRILMLML